MIGFAAVWYISPGDLVAMSFRQLEFEGSAVKPIHKLALWLRRFLAGIIPPTTTCPAGLGRASNGVADLRASRRRSAEAGRDGFPALSVNTGRHTVSTDAAVCAHRGAARYVGVSTVPV